MPNEVVVEVFEANLVTVEVYELHRDVTVTYDTGVPGREVQMRNDGTYIQWRLTGNPDWINLVSLASLGVGGGSGAAVWGTVTGLIDAQLDLKAKFDAVEDEIQAWVDTTVNNILAHTNDTGNPHNVTKAQVGLGNVDNTSDSDKPVSAAQALAIDLAKNDAIAHLRDGVDGEGDTLQKLYNLIISSVDSYSVIDRVERDSLNIKFLSKVLVENDGDGNWALYMATSAGVGATYIKISDPDLLNAVLTNSQIKTAYESNPDTNAFTNTLLAKLNGIAAGATANDTDANLKERTNHTGTQTASTISDFAATVRATVLTGLSLVTGSAIAATDTVLAALGKLQKQITDNTSAITGKQDTLVSGTNVKTLNGSSILGGGNLSVSGYLVKTPGHASLSTLLTSTTASTPYDNTIPQNTEGIEVLTLSYTPSDAANILHIYSDVQVSGNSTLVITGALFKNSEPDAIAAKAQTVTNGAAHSVTLTHRMVAGTTAPITFAVRVGMSAAGTMTINGAGGAQRLGGIIPSHIRIEEYKP